jgi:hypothetical protein
MGDFMGDFERIYIKLSRGELEYSSIHFYIIRLPSASIFENML